MSACDLGNQFNPRAIINTFKSPSKTCDPRVSAKVKLKTIII